MAEKDPYREGLTLDRIDNIHVIAEPPDPGDPEKPPSQGVPPQDAGPRLLSPLRSPAVLPALLGVTVFVCLVVASFVRNAAFVKRQGWFHEIRCVIGGEHQVTFRIRMPPEVPKDGEDLVRWERVLRHELIVAGSRPDLRQALRREDREGVRRFLADLVQRTHGGPRPGTRVEVEVVDLRPHIAKPLEDR